MDDVNIVVQSQSFQFTSHLVRAYHERYSEFDWHYMEKNAICLVY